MALDPDQVALARSLVLHEDAHALVLNKPSGLSSQARGDIVSVDVLLGAFARSNGKRPKLVHRLDRETSGVLLAAKTYPAAGFFGKALAARDAQKSYLALVCGGDHLPIDADGNGQFDQPLRRVRDPAGFDAMVRAKASDTDAEAALTRFAVLARGPGWAWAEVFPVTGRMHQIRAHFAGAGAPLAGDHKYGGLSQLGAGAASVRVPRLMLHARRLDMPHPDGGRLVVEAPLPPDMAQVLAQLEISQR